MSQRERMITQWKSLTITNKRIIQKKGFLFWKVYQDVMRRDITSIFTGRMPLFKVLGIGTLCIFLSVLGIFLMPEMFEEYSFILVIHTFQFSSRHFYGYGFSCKI